MLLPINELFRRPPLQTERLAGAKPTIYQLIYEICVYLMLGVLSCENNYWQVILFIHNCYVSKNKPNSDI